MALVELEVSDDLDSFERRAGGSGGYKPVALAFRPFPLGVRGISIAPSALIKACKSSWPSAEKSLGDHVLRLDLFEEREARGRSGVRGLTGASSAVPESATLRFFFLFLLHLALLVDRALQ